MTKRKKNRKVEKKTATSRNKRKPISKPTNSKKSPLHFFQLKEVSSYLTTDKEFVEVEAIGRVVKEIDVILDEEIEELKDKKAKMQLIKERIKSSSLEREGVNSIIYMLFGTRKG